MPKIQVIEADEDGGFDISSEPPPSPPSPPPAPPQVLLDPPSAADAHVSEIHHRASQAKDSLHSFEIVLPVGSEIQRSSDLRVAIENESECLLRSDKWKTDVKIPLSRSTLTPREAKAWLHDGVLTVRIPVL
jgi:hypothetical protein